MTTLILAAILPFAEMRIIDSVASEYSLSREQKCLMVAIRRSENGVPPYYFGVADRRCNTYLQQARWTANTIRRRYDGNLARFAHRWCPTDTATWLRNVRFFLAKQGYRK